jgi:signal transduction histidine kinase
MKRNLNGFSRRYQAALRRHLKQRLRAGLAPAQGLGRLAITIGLETLDLARIHEQALSALVLPGHTPGARAEIIRRAGVFFAEAITPIEETHRIALEATVHLGQLNEALRQRSAELAASNRQLKEEIAQRKAAEESFKQSERHSAQLLAQSRRMQDQLRLLSRQLLSAQEEERKKISRELHDVIAQTLTTINVRLAALKSEAALNTEGLEKSIARTQLLVQRSVEIVHRFARELRPAVLDDLGLIPALQTFMKNFQEQTGIRVTLSSFAAVEQVSGATRTVLYRVAQEALNNVARHAQASQAEVTIQKLDGAVSMRIKDNGKGFHQERLSNAKRNRRLGLLGMRERVEMVNGSFTVESALGKGTRIQAQIPLANGGQGASRLNSATT